MAVACSQIHQPFAVIGIGDSKLHPVWIRRGIQQPQTRMRRHYPHLKNSLNGSASAFYEGSHAFFFNGGQPSRKITGLTEYWRTICSTPGPYHMYPQSPAWPFHFAARPTSISLRPMASTISSKMAVPPKSVSRSKNRPTTTFPASPLV